MVKVGIAREFPMTDLSSVLSQVKPGEYPAFAFAGAESNIADLKRSFTGADLAEENEDNTDWKALAEERRLEAENERAKASALQAQMDIHVKRIERWEKQFDLINLPRIIDALKNIIDYPTALIALNEFDRDWFIAAQLSEEGKVSFARELLAVIQRFAPGENTNLLEAISTANAATLNGLWKDSTSNEIEE